MSLDAPTFIIPSSEKSEEQPTTHDDFGAELPEAFTDIFCSDESTVDHDMNLGLDRLYFKLFNANKEIISLRAKVPQSYIDLLKFFADNNFIYYGSYFHGYPSERWVNKEHRCVVSVVSYAPTRLECMASSVTVRPVNVNNQIEYLEDPDKFDGVFSQDHKMAAVSESIAKTLSYGIRKYENGMVRMSDEQIQYEYTFVNGVGVPKSLTGHVLFSLRKADQEFNRKFVNFWTSLSHEFKKPKADSRFKMIRQTSLGFSTLIVDSKPIPIKDERYDLYYGKKFPYEKIKKFVTDDTDNLLLLHGLPGTGKSNFLKNLCADSTRDIIYIPPNMVSAISQPTFVDFMMQNKGSILLIEDAEEILSKERNSATNNLLGITDGFLKDAMDMKIICTFNKSIKDVDNALLRKGRLYLEYEFGKLTPSEIYNLANELELNIPDNIKDDLTLTEIFNFHTTNTDGGFENTRKIGFLQ